jgi:hypothetical protein
MLKSPVLVTNRRLHSEPGWLRAFKLNERTQPGLESSARCFELPYVLDDYLQVLVMLLVYAGDFARSESDKIRHDANLAADSLVIVTPRDFNVEKMVSKGLD